MITPELFPRLAQRQTNVHKKNNPHVGYVHADQLSENQYNDLVRIMQWEKQVGDTIRKGETILLCEGEESLTGASSSLRVLKDVIAEDDCMLVAGAVNERNGGTEANKDVKRQYGKLKS